MPSRYLLTGTDCPQPRRKIKPADTDILHPYKMGERIDTLAKKYYQDATLGWIIMCANPDFDNEFEVPFGVKVRVPFPVQRVYDSWNIQTDNS